MAYLAVENGVKKGPNASRCEVAFLASRPARPGPSYASLSAGGTRTSQNPVHRSEPSRFSRTNRGQLTNLSSNWSSCSRVWLERFGWRFSGFHVAQLTARRGRGMFCRLACHCELFHKTGIARGRDEQRCFRRVQNYFGVLREKELFDRPFFFSPQASPAEQLQVNEVDHLRDSMFCGRIWKDVEEQWKDNSSKNRYSINGERTS